MRRRKPYSLYKRKVGSKTIYYYSVFDEYGEVKRYSTGCTSISNAMDVITRRIKDGNLINRDSVKAPPTFGSFAEKWWTVDCDYLKAERESGRDLSPGYIATQRGLLQRYLIPAFGKKRLEQINVAVIEKWKRSLLEGTAPVKIPENAKGSSAYAQRALSPKYVNNLTSLFSTMLQEAKRQGYIDKNPCRDLRGLSDRSKSRGVLTTIEAKKLFLSKAWTSEIARVASLLAAVTGMRSGEVLALRYDDVKVDHIHVEHSWDPDYGLKGTKTGDTRDLPLPDKVMDALINIRKIKTEGDYIFSVFGDKPVSRVYLLNHLRRTMDAEGIDWEKRNVGFHSWRHFLNTQLLSHGISGEKTREITGHTTEEMTQRYKHFELEDYRDILDVTDNII